MSSPPISILLIEDNPGDARLFREMLKENRGQVLRVITASTLAEGIDSLRQSSADVILLDLSLPDSRGLQTIARVQQVDSSVPIVVLTGLGDEDAAVQAVQSGAQDYVVKSDATTETLGRAIRYAIERRRAEFIEHERKTLETTLHGMDEVLAVVAHDLRIPLAAIRATAEVLLEEKLPDPSISQSFLQSIHDEVLRMNGMVDDILEAARMESGAAKWHWGTIRALKVCQDAIDVVRPLLEGKSVELRACVEPEYLGLNGDADALRRLLVNLLSNAIKHTTKGEIVIHVTERRTTGERIVDFNVIDTGEGMTPEVCERLGVAFALNSGPIGTAAVKGAGFGLAICRGIVAAHGGFITVTSTPGRGSSFIVHLSADLPGPLHVETGPPPIMRSHEAMCA